MLGSESGGVLGVRLRRGINFWVKDHTHIYLIGNPMVWWLGSLAVFGYIAVRGFLVLRAKRGYRDVPQCRHRGSICCNRSDRPRPPARAPDRPYSTISLAPTPQPSAAAVAPTVLRGQNQLQHSAAKARPTTPRSSLWTWTRTGSWNTCLRLALRFVVDSCASSSSVSSSSGSGPATPDDADALMPKLLAAFNSASAKKRKTSVTLDLDEARVVVDKCPKYQRKSWVRAAGASYAKLSLSTPFNICIYASGLCPTEHRKSLLNPTLLLLLRSHPPTTLYLHLNPVRRPPVRQEDPKSWYPKLAVKITLVEALLSVMFSKHLIEYTMSTFKESKIDILTPLRCAHKRWLCAHPAIGAARRGGERGIARPGGGGGEGLGGHSQQALDIGACESLENRWAMNWSRSAGKSAKAEGQTHRYTPSIMAQQALDIGACESLENRWAMNWSRSAGKSAKARAKRRGNCCSAAAVMIVITIARNSATVPYPSLHVLLMQKSPILLIPIKSFLSARIFTTTTHARTPNLPGFPRILVHPSVFAVALSQLRDGASFADVKKKNRELFLAGSYKDFPANIRDSPYRWLLEPKDSRAGLHDRVEKLNVDLADGLAGFRAGCKGFRPTPLRPSLIPLPPTSPTRTPPSLVESANRLGCNGVAIEDVPPSAPTTAPALVEVPVSSTADSTPAVMPFPSSDADVDGARLESDAPQAQALAGGTLYQVLRRGRRRTRYAAEPLLPLPLASPFPLPLTRLPPRPSHFRPPPLPLHPPSPFPASKRYDALQRAFCDCQLALQELGAVLSDTADSPAQSSKSALSLSPNKTQNRVLQSTVEWLHDYTEDARVELEIRVADEQVLSRGWETIVLLPGRGGGEGEGEGGEEAEAEVDVRRQIAVYFARDTDAQAGFQRKLDDVEHNIAVVKRAVYAPPSLEPTPPISAAPVSPSHMGCVARRRERETHAAHPPTSTAAFSSTPLPSGTDVAEHKWCVAVSNLIQTDPSTRRLLHGKNIVGALITRLTDSEEGVAIEALGALRYIRHLRVKCFGTLECLAMSPASASMEANATIAAYLLSMLPSLSALVSPAGTEPMLQAAASLIALIDIYSDEGAPFPVRRTGRSKSTGARATPISLLLSSSTAQLVCTPSGKARTSPPSPGATATSATGTLSFTHPPNISNLPNAAGKHQNGSVHLRAGPGGDKGKDKDRDRERERAEMEAREREAREREHHGAGGSAETRRTSSRARSVRFLTATASADWTLVLDVCDHASATEANAKEAVRALRREFKYGEPAAQLAAARVWAIMLRNSADTFISQSTSRKFLDTLEDLLTSRTSPIRVSGPRESYDLGLSLPTPLSSLLQVAGAPAGVTTTTAASRAGVPPTGEGSPLLSLQALYEPQDYIERCALCSGLQI
ncbi:hypothetical protein B0H14DRAFT_3875402 [Mycena olivaceomarginata]|nr:hypothetical protein B0H14DRAFT_3875402 [Mycena olivaceomarginata]